jgi:hypothetical protein
MLDQVRIAVIGETSSESPDETGDPLGLLQQKATGV